MPLGEAFVEAHSVLEKGDDYEIESERRIERLMRNAIADGPLQLFVRTGPNQLERIVECEEWRQEAFGFPALDNVADPVMSPGVDTDGRPVFAKIVDFREWLMNVRHEINPFRTGGPGKPSAIKVVERQHQNRLANGEALASLPKEAAVLKDWLDRHYPDAPRMTAKTIENRIRARHRSAKSAA
jgi:hypothetical protein